MSLLSVADALSAVLSSAAPLPAERVALSAAVLGRVLAEGVAADADSPPFDKAMMDGYALRSADLAILPATLDVLETVHAGATPSREVVPGASIRIMTGAPVPAGADAVVPVERSRSFGERVEILPDAGTVRPGANVLPRAREMRSGEVVLAAGTAIGPAHLGVLAAVGRTDAVLYRRPTLAVLCTGDELVEPPAVPGPGRIRNSNGPMLLAQAARAGCDVRYLGVAPDEPGALRAALAAGLGADVLLLTGGVSMGDADFVPGVLAESGVASVFHKVAMKPGKPLFFGATAGGRLVFGLPGNPVSAFVGFELFARPALARMSGDARPWPRRVRLPLAGAVRSRSDRQTFLPAALGWHDGGPAVTVVPWFGSADLLGLTRAACLADVPAGDVVLAAGSPVDVILLEGP